MNAPIQRIPATALALFTIFPLLAAELPQPSTTPTPSGAASPEAIWQRENGGTDQHRMQWWRDTRLAMFLHSGRYALDGFLWKGRAAKTQPMRRHLKIPIHQ